jgi:hypothetical protein
MEVLARVVLAAHLMSRLSGARLLEEGICLEVSVDMVSHQGSGVQEEAGQAILSMGQYLRYQTGGCLTSDQFGT